MTQRANEVTKDQLVSEFNTVVAETGQLVKSVATAGGEQAGALRASVDERLAAASLRLQKLQEATTDKARAAVKTTDDYVRANPWQIIGVVAAVTAAAAVLLGTKLNRR